MQCVEVCPGDEPGIMVKCEIVVYLFNSLGSIAPFGVNILRTFRVHSAVWRHSNTYGYSPVQALHSRASISRTATQTTLYNNARG